ncbi:MAG: TolC family protein [Planctomycetota bacterium]
MSFPQPTHLTILTVFLFGACSSQQAADFPGRVAFQQQHAVTSSAGLGSDGAGTTADASLFESPTFSLQQAIDLVLQQNPGVEIAAARIAQAATAVNESRAAFRPQVNLDLGYTRADAPSSYLFKTIDARGFVPGTDFNNPGAFSNWGAGLGVGYNLYSGGAHRLAGERAQLQQRVAELELSSLHNRLTAMTIDVWFAGLVAFEQQKVAALSVQTVQAQLAETKVLFEEGKVLRSDVLSLQVRLAEAKEMAIRNGNGVKMARIALASLLAVPESEMPALEVSVVESQRMSVPADLASALTAAFEQRPELEQLRVSLQQSELLVAQVEAGSKPSIDLFGRVWADNPNIDFAGSEANWDLGLAASWSLFDGGARHARAARAKAQIVEVQARHRAMLSEVRQDVEFAYLAVGEASARLDVASGAVELALESLRLVRAQYEEGVATITRYLEVEQMATFAQQRLNQATFDRKRAAADLARAMGVFAQP